jgi:hypothetical protein
MTQAEGTTMRRGFFFVFDSEYNAKEDIVTSEEDGG